jgi:hypothetical protein
MSLNYYFWNKMADPSDKVLATPSQALWHRAGMAFIYTPMGLNLKSRWVAGAGMAFTCTPMGFELKTLVKVKSEPIGTMLTKMSPN